MTDPIPLRPDQAESPFTTLRCANMLAVASGKGGVGKTWFSITLCQCMAGRGKRVLLFDGDFGLANVDIQLGLTPDRDLGDVIDNKFALRETVTKYPEGGFDILAGRSGSGYLVSVPPQKLSDLRQELFDLSTRYDTVIVDLGAGIDRVVRQMSGPAAATLVVVTDEPTSLTDAYAYIKLTYAANPQADLRVVVNMAQSLDEGRKTFETLSKVCTGFLRKSPSLAGIIRRDAKVRDTIRAQRPLLTRFPNSTAASDVDSIAMHILND